MKSAFILSLAAVDASSKHQRSILERAKEIDAANALDSSLLESGNTLRTTPIVTNEARPLDQKRNSDALYKGDQTDHLKTDTMGEWDKHYEDSWF